jgi:hypothetical protein
LAGSLLLGVGVKAQNVTAAPWSPPASGSRSLSPAALAQVEWAILALNHPMERDELLRGLDRSTVTSIECGRSPAATLQNVLDACNGRLAHQVPSPLATVLKNAARELSFQRRERDLIRSHLAALAPDPPAAPRPGRLSQEQLVAVSDTLRGLGLCDRKQLLRHVAPEVAGMIPEGSNRPRGVDNVLWRANEDPRFLAVVLRNAVDASRFRTECAVFKRCLAEIEPFAGVAPGDPPAAHAPEPSRNSLRNPLNAGPPRDLGFGGRPAVGPNSSLSPLGARMLAAAAAPVLGPPPKPKYGWYHSTVLAAYEALRAEGLCTREGVNRIQALMREWNPPFAGTLPRLLTPEAELLAALSSSNDSLADGTMALKHLLDKAPRLVADPASAARLRDFARRAEQRAPALQPASEVELSDDEIEPLIDAAQTSGHELKAFVAGIDPGVVGGFESKFTPLVDGLAKVGLLLTGEYPLLTFLQNGAALTAGQPELQRVFRDALERLGIRS